MRNEMNQIGNLKKFIKGFLGRFASILVFPHSLIGWIHKIRGVKFKNFKKVFFAFDVYIDGRTPELVTLGEDVWLTRGVKILSHFHPPLGLIEYVGEMIEKPVVIGDHVFIGMNSVILPGVHICNNVIVGAGSIVTKSILYPGIYGGNPCKFIKLLEKK
ncbi:MAG: acyltransferase [Candidatus Absconditabacterales bacterium]